MQRFLYLAALSITVLAGHAAAHAHPLPGSGDKKVVFLSGMDSPDEVQPIIDQLEALFGSGAFGDAQVQAYSPDTPDPIFGGSDLYTYSASQVNEIKQYIVANQGPDLTVVVVSLGGALFRDQILPEILAEQGSLQVHALYSIEVMSHPGQNLTPSGPIPTTFDFELYVSLETPYVGLFAGVFKSLFHPGALQLDCTTGSCYFVTPNDAVTVSPNYGFTLDVHGDLVGLAQTQAFNLLFQQLQGELSADPATAWIQFLEFLTQFAGNPPIPPLPQEGDDAGATTGGGGTVTGGGGGTSGGGVGIESFPAWIPYRDYLIIRAALMSRTDTDQPSTVEAGGEP